MRQPIFKLILNYVSQLIEAVSGIGFYDHVIADIEKQKNSILPVHEGFKTQLQDREYVSTLSLPEQQALGQNEINYKHLVQQMDESVSYLIKQKWTSNIRAVLYYLNDTKLLLEDVLGNVYDLVELGQTIRAKQLLEPKRYKKAGYAHRIALVQIAIDTLCSDVVNDSELASAESATESVRNDIPFIKFAVKTGLGKAFRTLQLELEDIETNGMPNPHTFTAPEIIIPEVPDSPTDKINENGKTIDFASRIAGQSKSDNEVDLRNGTKNLVGETVSDSDK